MAATIDPGEKGSGHAEGNFGTTIFIPHSYLTNFQYERNAAKLSRDSWKSDSPRGPAQISQTSSPARGSDRRPAGEETKAQRVKGPTDD